VSPRRRLTVREKDYILAAQNNRCTICGDELDDSVEWDHIRARCMFGTEETSNFQALHERCHREVKTTADKRAYAKALRCERFMKEGRHRKRKGREILSRGFPKRPPQNTATRPIQKWTAWREGA